MLTTEQCFDMLPYVADIIEKLGLEKVIEESREQVKKSKASKDEKSREMGYKVMVHVVKKSSECKESFFPMLAILMDTTEEKAKQSSIGDTIKALKQIFEDTEVMDFFREAVREGSEKPSN